MDERHRQYCIKLGNPYMGGERYEKNLQQEQLNSLWTSQPKLEQDWLKNKKNQF